ncbi:hypothetical protein KC640_01645 [Candidatus Dojkabacteria bacterium]|uniref:Phosphatase PAP2 family protein n=1 Tax=Candidatus Dojkabacteria bacterium TaxID=2099670 RepID=A0A955ICY6_9BACT|nr:hypothetical protein [Candidatus Dojkabacteria bacterium]
MRQRKLTHNLARLLSIVFEPLIVFVVGTLFVAWDGGALEVASAFVFLSIVEGGFFLAIVYQYLHDNSPDFVPIRSERDAIYLAGIFASTVSTYVFGSEIFPSERWLNISMIFMMFFACFYLFNHYFDKASMHVGMSTIWILIAAQLISPMLGILLVLILPIAWSRLELDRHTWIEVMYGLLIGTTIGGLAWLTLV